MAALSRAVLRSGMTRRLPLPAGRAIGLLLLVAFLIVRYHDAFHLPFLNDDYVFLDHVRGQPFTALWGFRNLAFHWWRPWSREFHYWWLERAFGPQEPAFHVASVVLAGGVLAAYWALARRLIGAPGAVIAAAGAATLPGWGLLLLWAAGAQDLWMMFLSLLALLAWHAGRPGWAALAFAFALASKETAALLPLLFLAHDAWVARRPVRDSALRLLPSLVILGLWALAHPLVLGRFGSSAPSVVPPSPAAIPPWLVVLDSARAAFSLDRWPAPENGWAGVAGDALRGALLLALFVELLARPDARRADVLGGSRATASTGTARLPGSGAFPFAFAWWLCGTLPLLLPGLGWHAYYAHFAGLGVWLATGRLLARRTAIATVLVAALAALGAARAATPSQDWGEAAYQRRAGSFVANIRMQLLALVRQPEPHTRLWFVRLPNNVGFLAGNGPAVRVWYGDPTLQAGYYSAYRPRAANEPVGPDRFFRMDEAGELREIDRGDTTAVATTAAATADTAGRATDPRWQSDQASLAAALARGRNWRGAAAEYRRLAIAFPDSAGYALDAATAFLQAGDSAAGYQWLREAARRPGAPPELLQALGAPAKEPPKPPNPASRGSRRRITGTHPESARPHRR